jgi:hypothetical protein
MTATTHTIATVKAELPDVTVRWNGQRWQARVSGRLNQFATVSPWVKIGRGRPCAIMGPCFHFSWDAVTRAVNGGHDLQA